MVSNTKKTIIVIGFIVCLIIIVAWANELSEIEVGQKSAFGDYWLGGDSPEAARAKRANINSKYGLYLFLTLVGSTAAVLIFTNKPEIKGPNDCKIKESTQIPESQEEELEIARLAELEGNSNDG